MGLKEYRARRNFKRSPEPIRPAKPFKTRSIFVVQRHDASHLHYDFRLEYKGVLWSWAIPKGPSRTAKVKRLAIRTEDHPLSYAAFEGVIPEGNYGAGTVKIWDRGTFFAKDAVSKADSEKRLCIGLKKGHLAITLQGKKLKGDFDLVFLRRGKLWILIKR